MNGIRSLQKGDEEIFRKWLRLAHADETVWPFLGTGQFFDAFMESDELPKTDWSTVVLIDSTETAILRLWNSRAHNSLDCGLWALNIATREVAVAQLLSVVPSYCRRYGKEWIDGGCHLTNAGSVKLHRKIFGEPCGVYPKARWDAREGDWVDGLSFRARIADVMKRYNPANEV